jgi:hypothetical protein
MDWRRKDQSARSVTRCSGRENWCRGVDIQLKHRVSKLRPPKLASGRPRQSWPLSGQLDFFRGTLAPFLRASERPIAMACLRLFTVPPLPPFPDLSVPRFFRCIALLTLLLAAFPYLRLPDVLRELAAINPSRRFRMWARDKRIVANSSPQCFP